MSLTGCSPRRNVSRTRRRLGSARASNVLMFICVIVYIHEYAYKRDAAAGWACAPAWWVAARVGMGGQRGSGVGAAARAGVGVAARVGVGAAARVGMGAAARVGMGVAARAG